MPVKKRKASKSVAKRKASKPVKKAKASKPAARRPKAAEAVPAPPGPAVLRVQALPTHKGLRLDKALVQLLESQRITRSQLTRYFDEGRVSLDGQPAVARRRLRGGESVELLLPPPAPTELKPAKIPLQILHEDKDLVVINKPAGLVTHPGAGHQDDTLANALLAHCKGSLKTRGLRPGIVHRLDKDTTGCLVAAKTEAAFTALQSMIAARQVTRLYLALVWGDLREDSGTIEAAMGRGPDRKKMALRPQGGKAAVTHFTVRERFKHGCELECRLETGRTHQIRVHLQGIGHSVVGDLNYGRVPGHLPAPLREGLPGVLARQALHAWRLQFIHPISGKPILAEAPPPADYRAARALLKEAE